MPPPTRVPAKSIAASVTAEEAGTRLEVRFASEAERPVAEVALALAREAVAHLAQVAEQPVGGWAILLVTPAHANAAPQHLRASADVVLHVWYVSERPLEEMASTWVWVHTLIHELWHGLEPPGIHPDRWLSDGLAEWVATSFVAPRAHETFKFMMQTPPAVALQEEYPPRPWPPPSWFSVARIRRLAQRDPAAAGYLGQREVRRYRTAYALVDRWLQAMADAGSAKPLADLLRELKRHRRVDFPTANAICQRLTGRSMAQLALYSAAEKIDLARQGWEAAISDDEYNVLWGLRVMSTFGVPPEQDLHYLIAALAGNSSADPACPANFELSRVVAAWGDDSAVTAIFDAYTANHDGTAPSKCALAPAFWLRWAERDRSTAVTRLAAIFADETISLRWHEEANRGLEQLTGSRTGWRTTANAARRAAAARRWQELAAGLPRQLREPAGR